MKLTKMFGIANDENMSRQERLFRSLVMMGLGGILIAIIAGIFAGENLENLLFMSGVFVVLTGITIFSIRFRKIQQGAALAAALIIYVVLPLNFFTGGGIHGGAEIWFMFGVIFVCLVVENRVKYFLLASSFVLCIMCYYIAYFHPEFIIEHNPEMVYLDSFFSLTVISVLTCCMILFQNAMFRSENAITQKQKKEIEELNRTQNNFFSSMSHEIRTPINTIIGLNEMILRADVPDEVAADAKNIQSASKMLLSLINDILDMSKVESGKMEIVADTYHVGDMLSDIVNMIWIRTKEKGLEFHIDVDNKIPSQLYGDEVRIKQILVNVLNNAVKYTSEGSVVLSIKCRKVENGIAQMVYTVTDTGIGIKKESIPYLFNAFKRVDMEKNRYVEGTGLGLSIVKQLVELMNGEVAVNSVYTKGSTFVITLPQKVMKEESIGELNLDIRHSLNTRKRYRQSFEAPNARVLIVDDSDTNLMVAEKLLRDTKIQIETVSNGTDCLKQTLNNHFDVILMDHLMPVMDGIECLHAIRNQTGGLNQNTPIVVLTANAGGDNQALYKREGFDGYLLKPVSGIQLESEVLKHLPGELLSHTGTDDAVGTMESSLYVHNKIRPFVISTDSTCDLPKEFIDRYKIAVIPCRVYTENGEFLDGIETETDGILSYMEAKGKRVSAESPDITAYEEFFADQLTKAQYVIHISLSTTVSRGYAHAVEASKIFDNVFVVDSGHLSSGMGHMVLRAAQSALENKDVDIILQELNQLKKKVNTNFIVSTTECLRRAGRISDRTNSLFNALMLHPMLTLKNGDLKVGAIWIGTNNYTQKKYISSVLRDPETIDKKLLFITYAGLSISELRNIEAQVKKKVAFERVIYQKACPAISTNCGPGCFGLLFLRD